MSCGLVDDNDNSVIGVGSAVSEAMLNSKLLDFSQTKFPHHHSYSTMVPREQPTPLSWPNL